jgi:hypothetical protein
MKDISDFGRGLIYINDSCIKCIESKKKSSVSTIFKKICTACKIEKDNFYFTKHIKSKDGFCEKCYECANAISNATEENKKRNERYLENKIKKPIRTEALAIPKTIFNFASKLAACSLFLTS